MATVRQKIHSGAADHGVLVGAVAVPAASSADDREPAELAATTLTDHPADGG
ncbi:hypothetical protein ACQPZA_21745 [Pseudonocardia xinjiangensis]|uniref:hypothetical protein n=1 Tax=Pseudonocardia xinjiangensis TaxID=75289 RepID=UPI003D8A40E1